MRTLIKVFGVLCVLALALLIILYHTNRLSQKVPLASYNISNIKINIQRQNLSKFHITNNTQNKQIKKKTTSPSKKPTKKTTIKMRKTTTKRPSRTRITQTKTPKKQKHKKQRKTEHLNNVLSLKMLNDRIYSNTFSNMTLSQRVKQFKPFDVKITLEERSVFYHLLNMFDTVARKHNITYYLSSGTLLGSYRHHDFVPWDDDVDVCVLYKFKRRLPVLFAAELNPAKYRFYATSNQDKLRIVGRTWPFLDIFYSQLSADDRFVQSVINEPHTGAYRIPARLVFPLRLRPMYIYSYPAPFNTGSFLRRKFHGKSCQCKRNFWMHITETSWHHGSVRCSSLKHKLPFVHRRALEKPDKQGMGLVEERLEFPPGTLVSSIVVREGILKDFQDYCF